MPRALYTMRRRVRQPVSIITTQKRVLNRVILKRSVPFWITDKKHINILLIASVHATCLFFSIFLLAEIERIQKGETKKEPEKETYLDLFATKNLKLKERVLIPTKQYPRVGSFFISFRLDDCLMSRGGAWSSVCFVTIKLSQCNWLFFVNSVFLFVFPPLLNVKTDALPPCWPLQM